MTKKGSFFWQSVIAVNSKAITMLLIFVISVFTARFFGPEGKGRLALLMNLPNIVLAFTSLGIRQSSAYFISKDIYDNRHISGNMMCLYITLSMISLAITLSVYCLLGITQSNGYLVTLLFAMYIPFQLFYNYFSGILISGKKVNLINMLQNIYYIVVVLTLSTLFLLSYKHIAIVAISMLFGLIIINLFLLITIRGKFTFIPSFDFNIQRSLVGKGVVFAAALCLMQLNYRLDIYLLGYLKNDISVGIYSVGVGIGEIIQQVPLAIGLVLFSRSLNWKDVDIDKSLIKVARLNRILIALVAVIGIMFLCIMPKLVPLVYGPEFIDSVKVVYILLIGIIALSSYQTLHIFAAGQGNVHLTFYAFVPGIIINILLNLFLIPKYNYIGCAISSSISYTLSTLIYYYIFCRRYRVKLLDFVLLKPKDLVELRKALYA